MDFKQFMELAKEKKAPISISKAIENSDIVKLYLLILCQKWLREEHRIFVSVDFESYQPDVPKYSADVHNLSSKNMGERLLDGFTLCDTYEQALMEGVYESLKLL
jgi:hypothetical protein